MDAPNVSYTNTVAKYFPEVSVKLLCAIIDQHQEDGLPNWMLRKELVTVLRKFVKNNKLTTKDQAKSLNRASNDLKHEDSELLQIQCKYKTGETFILDLNVSQIVWDVGKQNIACDLSYSTTIYENQAKRTLNGLLNSQRNKNTVLNVSDMYRVMTHGCPTLDRESITECDNWKALDALFKVSAEEERLMNALYCPECSAKEAYPEPPFEHYVTHEASGTHKKVTQYQCMNCNNLFYQ